MTKNEKEQDEFGPRGSEHPMTCATLWEKFSETKPYLSEASKNNFKNVASRFFNYFDESMPIDRLTTEQLSCWKSRMLLTYSPATTTQTLQTTKSVFRLAVSMNWLPSNPLNGIDYGSFRNPDSNRFVTRGEFRKIREQCSTWEQRAILTLTRYGGMRSPSEVVRLKWSDIDWEKRSIFVISAKPNANPYRRRLVPLFPAVRRVLEEAIPNSSKYGYIVTGCQETAGTCFGAWFSRLVQKAGMDRIPRPFDNMRSSRATELYHEFGQVHTMAWMGYASIDHYRLLSVHHPLEAEFKRATEWEEGE